MSNVAHLISVFHVWSTKRNIQPSAVHHPAVHCYHEKSSVSGDVDPYCDVKKKYIEDRGIPWCLSNKRPERLKDTLLEVEELLHNHSIVVINWKSSRNIQIVLSNGVILLFTIATDSPDLERLTIDKSLLGKLEDVIYNGIVGENFMLFSYLENHKALLVNFSKRATKDVVDKKEIDKLSSYDLKLSTIKLPIPSGRNSRGIKKFVTSNKTSDLVCIWWYKVNKDVGTPWSPAAIDEEDANMVMCSVTGISSVYTVDMITYGSSTGELIDCCFSMRHHAQLLTLEEYNIHSSRYLLEACVYELTDNKLTKVSVIAIPSSGFCHDTYETYPEMNLKPINNVKIPAKMCLSISTAKRLLCRSRNHSQNRIALACENHELLIWDEYQKKITATNISLVCDSISWHPSDSIIVVASVSGELQIYDIALNCLHLLLVGDGIESSNLRLSQLFFTPPKLNTVSWSCDYGLTSTPDSCCCCDDILVAFDRGPLCVLRIELGVCSQGKIGATELVCEYMKYNQLKEAVSILKKLSWNTNAVQCFHILILLTSHVFKQPFNAATEACLEDALGTFYAPVRPLHEAAILQYRDEVSRIARRFFHRLLRYKRFEKAFLLAVDIGAKDLFMDIYYLAIDVRNFDLAKASQQRAQQLHHSDSIEGVNNVPVNFFDDEFGDELPLTRQLNSMHLSTSRQEVNARIDLPTTSPQQPVEQYNFDDLCEEERSLEDPMPWTLNSRTDQASKTEVDETLKKVARKLRKKKKNENLLLVHFGHV